jgi:hypothetical protein
MSFYKSTKKELDPLDREILERAFDVTWESIKQSHLHSTLTATRSLRLRSAGDVERYLVS